jgi:hypothetical protein
VETSDIRVSPRDICRKGYRYIRTMRYGYIVYWIGGCLRGLQTEVSVLYSLPIYVQGVIGMFES